MSSSRRSVKAARGMLYASSLMLCTFCIRPAEGIENQDFAGFWQGTLKSEAFPAGVSGTLDVWEEGEGLVGVVGNQYGVFKLTKIAIKTDPIQLEFLSPLGIGAIEGQLDENKTFKFAWKLVKLVGTGEAVRADPGSAPALAVGDLVGYYKGQAKGPMMPEPVDVSLQLEPAEGGLGGSIQSPVGKFTITKGLIKHQRVILEIMNDEEMSGLIVGSKHDDKIDIFWTIAIGAGKATLSKGEPPPVDFAPAAPPPDEKKPQ